MDVTLLGLIFQSARALVAGHHTRKDRMKKAKGPISRADVASVQLGYQDSNLEQKNQNLPCCQLHHTPPSHAEAEPTSYSNARRRVAQNARYGAERSRSRVDR